VNDDEWSLFNFFRQDLFEMPPINWTYDMTKYHQDQWGRFDVHGKRRKNAPFFFLKKKNRQTARVSLRFRFLVSSQASVSKSMWNKNRCIGYSVPTF
jgi:hypothetical protein